MSYCFGSDIRLKKPCEYSHVFKGGNYLKGKYWTIISNASAKDTSRLGLAIAKKIHNLAVDRNRVKRIAREIFRTNSRTLANVDIVVMAKKSKGVANNILAIELAKLFTQITHR